MQDVEKTNTVAGKRYVFGRSALGGVAGVCRRIGIAASFLAAFIVLNLTSDSAVAASSSRGPASCPATSGAWCQTSKFCVGMNTGFFGASNLDRPFIDQMRGAHITVDTYDPANIVRNTLIPLDENKYPKSYQVKVTVKFYTNKKASFPLQLMPSDRFVVLWDGVAADPVVIGKGVSNVVTRRNRIAFNLDTVVRGEAAFQYQNAVQGSNVSNIRIVPIRYEDNYKDWSWTAYRVGARSNPPIFFPQWLDKMAAGCTIRYMNSTQTNDQNAVLLRRDSTRTRIPPANSVWYEGFNLGRSAEIRHQWPWELIVEATRQTKTRPWINFRIMTYENMVAGDPLVADVARLFNRRYGGPVYVEYGNELWNFGWPFNVATGHVRDTGPGANKDLNENYTLRTNAIQKTFADAYGDDGCLALGVLGTQGRNPWHAERRMEHADVRYVDILSPAAYLGDNVTPDTPIWEFLGGLYDSMEAGTLTRSNVYDVIKDELVTGRRGVMVKNWKTDLHPSLKEHSRIADDYGICTAFYESGFHMRVDKIDFNDLRHLGIAEMIRQYRRSTQQRDVEKVMYDGLRKLSTGPSVAYASVGSSGYGAFSYWDSMFDTRASEVPRTKLLRETNDPRTPVLIELAEIKKRLKRARATMFRSAAAAALLSRKLSQLERAVAAGRRRSAARLAGQFSSRINGCGHRADADDYFVHCRHQKNLQKRLAAVRDGIQDIPRRAPSIN